MKRKNKFNGYNEILEGQYGNQGEKKKKKKKKSQLTEAKLNELTLHAPPREVDRSFMN